MNNLMGDIPAWALDSDSDDGDADNPQSNSNGGGKGDIEMQEQTTAKTDENSQYMSTFFSEVDNINADIKAVAQASKDIGIINEQSMRATTTAEEQKLSSKLGPLIDTNNKRAKRTKDLLGLLKQETDQLKAEGKLNASNVRYVKSHDANSITLSPLPLPCPSSSSSCSLLSHTNVLFLKYGNTCNTCTQHDGTVRIYFNTKKKLKCERKYEYNVDEKIYRRDENISTVTAKV